MITANVIDNTLTVQGLTATTNSIGYPEINFNFSEDWANRSKIAVFRYTDENDSVKYASSEIVEDKCAVPSVCVSTVKTFYIGVVGELFNQGGQLVSRITTPFRPIPMSVGAMYTDLIPPTAPTETIWSEYFALINQALSNSMLSILEFVDDINSPYTGKAFRVLSNSISPYPFTDYTTELDLSLSSDVDYLMPNNVARISTVFFIAGETVNDWKGLSVSVYSKTAGGAIPAGYSQHAFIMQDSENHGFGDSYIIFYEDCVIEGTECAKGIYFIDDNGLTKIDEPLVFSGFRVGDISWVDGAVWVPEFNATHKELLGNFVQVNAAIEPPYTLYAWNGTAYVPVSGVGNHTHANKALLDEYDGTGGAGIIIADTVDDLPEDATDGALGVVRAVEQTLQFATYNVDTLLGNTGPGAYLVSAALPQVFFNRHPPRADFTELGVPEQLLVMGGTSTFGAVKTIWIENGGQTTERPHLHYAYQVDMYDMMYAPAGMVGAVPVLFVNDHRLGDLLDFDDPPYMRYLYFWDDFYDGEELRFGADTWHEVTDWDEDGQPTAFTEIDGIPSATESQCHYFSNDAAGEAAQAYFGKIINTVPFENAKFAKIDGVWTRI